MPRTTPLLLRAVLFLLALSATVLTAPTASAATVQLELPRPTGQFAVGRDTLHLVDASRPDPWVPEAGARELLVSLSYPARPGTGDPAAYMTTAEAERLLKNQGYDTVVPAETVSATRTNARTSARPAPGRFPLVLLSPGFTLPRTTLTLLSEEIASRGYVVAAVDHAYESVATTFPGGRLLPCVACEKYKETGLAKVTEIRARDFSFVTDELTGDHSRHATPSPYAAMIDPRRIGVAGHSVGGASAVPAMAGDPRFRAGANLDGGFFTDVPAAGLGARPFLMLGTRSTHSPGNATWDLAWQRLDGWKRWLTVTDAGHFTFTDLPVLAGQLGITDPDAPLPGARSGEITRAYLAAFFDLHLRHLPQPLLSGPTPTHPEVTFQHT
ncbi:alpha/beta hydrolase [Streptomyces roseirectus]|uniref:Alpha/beta hydrolase n=1 Tax=Streptomyces roseirectus TaxID=2768066 RepID=A0A7H0IG67_9ACTN|nr:alpha/beta hydrolase [Streptomyces roseirectus]QNP71783.1 alpha/beta hydrolase [Streptomyces roseirectus]